MTNSPPNHHPWPTGRRKGWLPGDISFDRLRHRFGLAELAAIRALIDAVRAAGTPLFEVSPAQFRHPLLDRFMLPLVDELKVGPGVVLLSGFDLLGKDLDDWRLAYWGIGTYFGNQVSQSVRGDLMGSVKVQPELAARAYTSAGPISLHCDRIDILTLLCVQNALRGGENGIASSLAIRDIVERERPDVLAILERGFRQSRLGEERPGDDPITPYRVPVFATKDGVTSCLLSGNALISHQRNTVKDDLSAREIEALEYFASVLQRPDIRITVPLQIGEAVFLNNYEVVHARDTFEESDDPAKKRHLLRMWIAGCPERPRVKEQTVNPNPSGKQGIDPQPDKVMPARAISAQDAALR